MRRADSKNKYNAPKTWKGMYDLYQGKEVDELQMAHSITFIKERWDCSDFRMVPLIRTLYQLRDKLSADALQMLTDTILCFKYWMDEPGEDDMCYTTENHQILFHSSEYLAGQYFKDKVFRNSSMTGAEHQAKAKKMILQWLEHRFVYGMSEWHSPVYYEEDIPPLCNLIDFAEDDEVATKAKMVLDIFLLDIAMHSYKGSFTVTSGRCYTAGKKYPKLTDTAELIDHIWDFGLTDGVNYERLSTMFYMMDNYEVPEVIKAIGYDTSEVEIKTSMSVDLNEFKEEISGRLNWEDAGRYLWSMGGFASPKALNLTMRLAHKYKVFDNSFMRALQPFNNPVFRGFRLYGVISKVLNPYLQGTVLERNNTYTYKTKDYMMSTAQSYHPGEFSEQHHIWSATLNDEITVFTTSPSTWDMHKDNHYWVGNDRLPHSVQHKNVNLSMYKLASKKAFMEKERCYFTHAYFPVDLFDQTVIKEKALYGQSGDSYVAVIAKNPLEVNPKDSSDYLQKGQDTFWITEIASKENYDSFEAFIEAIEAHKISYDGKSLTYKRLVDYNITYKGAFKVDGQVVDTNYSRFDTPYIKVDRRSRIYDVKFGVHQLHLDFDQLIRKAEPISE